MQIVNKIQNIFFLTAAFYIYLIYSVLSSPNFKIKVTLTLS